MTEGLSGAGEGKRLRRPVCPLFVATLATASL